MSDRIPDWAAQNAAFLETLRAQQRTLEESWSGWFELWRRGLPAGDGRTADGSAARGTEGEDARGVRGVVDAAKGEGRSAASGPIEWYLSAAGDTVAAIGALSRALLGGAGGRGEDPASLWRRLAGDPSAGGPFGAEGGAAAIRPDVLLRAFMAPWAAMSGGGTPIAAHWLGAPLPTGPFAAPDGGGPGPNLWDGLSRLAGAAARQVSFGPIDPALARRTAELSETSLASLAAMQRYEGLHLGALARIAERFAGELGACGERRDPPGSLRALFELWIECGDRVLLDLYRSDEYLAVQRELLESLMRYRVQWQALQDALARAAGRPTREELDDAHRAIHELRRELRAQRRRQRELAAAVPTDTEAT